MMAHDDPLVVVLVTSVAHRYTSLLKLLDGLAAQTRVPDYVFLRLDAYDDALLNTFEAWFASSAPGARRLSLIRWVDAGRGAGRRWQHPALIRLEDDAIVHTIDDDLVPQPEYIARTTKLVLEHDAAITWHGWANEQTALASAFFSSPATDTWCTTLGAGVSAMRWGWVKRLAQEAPDLAQACLDAGPQCDDDAWLSVHLWMHDYSIRRPAGTAPITELATSRGAGASFHHHAGYRFGQRLALALAFDWPALDHVFLPETLEAYRKTTPNSSPTAGMLSVFRAIGPEQRAMARENFAKALRAPSLKRRAAFVNGMLSELEELEPAVRLCMIGVGRWTAWAQLYLELVRLHVEPLVLSVANVASWPAGLSRPVQVETYELALEDLATRGQHFELLILAPHQSARTRELAAQVSSYVLELPEGLEQC